MEKTMVELETELKELKEKVSLYEQILACKKKLEELGIKIDREKEYIPYPIPYYPSPYLPPYSPTWITTNGIDGKLPNYGTVTCHVNGG
jgi:hypothetical protein